MYISRRVAKFIDGQYTGQPHPRKVNPFNITTYSNHQPNHATKQPNANTQLNRLNTPWKKKPKQTTQWNHPAKTSYRTSQFNHQTRPANKTTKPN